MREEVVGIEIVVLVHIFGFAGRGLCDLAAMRGSDGLGRFVGACLAAYVGRG